MTKGRMILRATISIAFLMVVWLLWSGFFMPLLIVLGLISCCLVALLSYRMGNLSQDSDWMYLLPRFPRFWLWLSKEVVKSNLQVARLILSPRPELSPTLVTIRALSEDAMGQAILGNSITLTPGTLTVDDDSGLLRVHCLTRAGALELREGEMNRRVAALTRH